MINEFSKEKAAKEWNKRSSSISGFFMDKMPI